MANRYVSSAVLGVLVMTSASVAQADRNLTLDDAIALARGHNRDLRAARERVVEAEGGVASRANYQVTEAGVLASVAQAYFAAAGADELVVARQDAVKVAIETFDVAKARVAAELANQVESTRAETALVRAQQDLAEAENTRAGAYRALATLLGTKEPF